MELTDVLEVMRCFDGCFMNQFGELIISDKPNLFFIISSCADKEEIQCKVLERLSRDALKGAPFNSDKKNSEYRTFVLSGINKYLGTSFTTEQMEPIYERLGNNINRNLCLAFIRSGFDMTLLERKKKD